MSKLNKKLVFDVGMHKGEDTEYYLSKGFDVVAFEADPNLVLLCKSRFEKEIKNNRLKIVEGAIVKSDFHKKIKFFKNKKNSVWGTVIKEWAERNEKDGAYSECIEVNSVDIRKQYHEYGIPYYLKIDIEGMDLVCCEALMEFNEKPSYISIESDKVSFKKLEREFELFYKLGYENFKIIQQDGISKQKEKNPSLENKFLNYKFSEGSSGVFGQDLPGKWISKDQALKKYKKIFFLYKAFGDNSLLRKFFLTRIMIKVLRKLTGIPIPGWYDTHSKHKSIN